MKRFFGRKDKNFIIVEGGELQHLKKVLRMREGDEVIACANDEFEYFCTIEEISPSFARLVINSSQLCPATPKKHITLIQMLPKKDYLDSIVPKSIELGASELMFFTSQYTIGKQLRTDRIQQQVLTACKQCERSMLAHVHELEKFDKMIEFSAGVDVVVFANEDEHKKKFMPELVENAKKIAVVIGNEAGFTDEEREKIIAAGGKSITLGSRILRCDTAVAAVLALVGVFSNN